MASEARAGGRPQATSVDDVGSLISANGSEVQMADRRVPLGLLGRPAEELVHPPPHRGVDDRVDDPVCREAPRPAPHASHEVGREPRLGRHPRRLAAGADGVAGVEGVATPALRDRVGGGSSKATRSSNPVPSRADDHGVQAHPAGSGLEACQHRPTEPAGGRVGALAQAESDVGGRAGPGRPRRPRSAGPGRERAVGRTSVGSVLFFHAPIVRAGRAPGHEATGSGIGRRRSIAPCGGDRATGWMAPGPHRWIGLSAPDSGCPAVRPARWLTR